MGNELLEHMRQVRASARLLHGMGEVDSAIARVASALTRDYAERNPLLLTVMTGGVVFTGRLLPLLDFPLEYDYVHASRYRGETAGTDLQWKVVPGASMKDRDVVILDDILDVGSTLVAIRAACENQGARSVTTAVLVDKQHDRKAVPGLKADYTALEVQDSYLFGCGMDYRGYWRNAPGIFAVEGL